MLAWELETQAKKDTNFEKTDTSSAHIQLWPKKVLTDIRYHL